MLLINPPHHHLRFFPALVAWVAFNFIFSPAALAGSVLGVHILHPDEITAAATLIKTPDTTEMWNYVTIPLSLNDLDKHDQWQSAFDSAKNYRINPIVRLVSRFDQDQNAWAIPTRADIMSYFQFLSSLDWPHENRFIIVFNEPNHFNEWGGINDPASYAEVLRFTADWAHTENLRYQILPAAMDLAAANTEQTREAFSYLNAIYDADPDILTKIDYWNSHSYPNPAFSAAPSRTGQNSLQGFKHELAWLQDKTEREFQVFITETGWEENDRTRRQLDNYYAYANTHIWSDDRIIAVTPFVLKGDPGPFSKFTLIDQNGNFRPQYHAYARQIAANALKFKQEFNAINVATF
jgi:hypothetical protein